MKHIQTLASGTFALALLCGGCSGSEPGDLDLPTSTGAGGTTSTTGAAAGAAGATLSTSTKTGTAGSAGATAKAGAAGNSAKPASSAGSAAMPASTANTPMQGAAGAPSAAGASAGSAGVGAAAGAGAAVPAADRPLRANTIKLPTIKESPNVAPYFNVWRPMDLAALETPAPIVVWNNGGCFRDDGTWQVMYETWAAAGFVVLSLTNGGNGGTTTVADHGALIDWLEKQATADGPYKGKLDLERVASAGNSCGGITSLGLAAQDDRVKAIYILSGSSSAGGPEASVLSKVKIPVAYMVGSEDDLAHGNALADFDGFPAGVPALVYSRSSGDHVLISSDRTVIAQGAEISLNWFDLTLYGTKAALDVLSKPEPCKGCMPGLWTMKAKNLETLVR